MDVVAPVAPEVLPTPVRRRILVYLGVLIVLLAFGAPGGGLIDVPLSFLLKNKLHLSAQQVATFRLIAAIPLYLSGLFGFARDVRDPFGRGDRGFFMLFGGVTAALYVAFAFVPVTYGTLLVEIVLLTTAFLFVSGAQNGLTAAVGEQHQMSGQISAAWNIFGSIPGLVALVIGGSVSEYLEAGSADRAARTLFLLGAAAMAAVGLYGVWRPAVVFDNVRREHGLRHPLIQLRRLLRHWPVYPALLIWMLWNFAPGTQTPLQYYLQNTLHGSDLQWGEWNAIFAASFTPTFLLYGVLCRRYPLRTLLWWGTVAAVPQMVPLLFINSMLGALITAVPIGLMGGVATGAYLDLLIRSCPEALQGSVLMMSGALYTVVSRFGDVLGTALYDRYGGFGVCVAAITLVYAAILPVLWLVPRQLVERADA
ncbi:MAG TPA: MFS transporter [Acidisphaera sp.]|nr:MFS transporter [Acidisphaera sp.]